MSAHRIVLAGLCLALIFTLPALGQGEWNGTLVPTQTTQTLVNGEAAVLAECSNASGSIGTICIQSTYSTLDNKGSVTGVQANAAIAPVFHPQDGEVLGRLAVGSAFDAQGVFYGVFGQAIADEIDNFDFNRTSYALGGRFEGRSPTDSTLDLDGTGTYWVGGAFGRVSGTINNTPSSGAVAGIIGVDDSEGTARSYAGYFQGDAFFSNRVGIGVANPAFALDVNGTIRGSFFTTSDVRLKEEIQTLGGALETVRSLRGVRFHWADESIGTSPQIGVVAQEVEQVLPELVTTDDEGYKAVGYDKLTAVLIEAVKEQQSLLEKQQEEIAVLREGLRSLRAKAD